MICRFIVRKKSTQKYTTRTGQKTGMSKTRKKVMKNATVVATIRRCLHQRREGETAQLSRGDW